MTSAAVGQFDQYFMVITRSFYMTIQTPAHVHQLWVLGDRYFGHIAMAFLAVLPSSNMSPMVELNEIRHNRNRHPFNGRAAFHRLFQRGKQYTCLGFGDLIMAGPTLGRGGNSR